MSLIALANDYTSRREQSRLTGLVLEAEPPRSFVSLLGTTAKDASGATVTGDSNSQQFIQALMKYVPTEIVSAYLVLVGLVPSTATASAGPYLWTVFWVCLILAPSIVYALSYASTRAVSGGAIAGPPVLPLFQMAAAAVAFVLWAAILPNSVILANWITSWEAVGAVVIGTIVLHMLGIFFGSTTPEEPLNP